MFHCSGWTYTWAVTAVGGTHVCLRRVDPALIFPAIARHRVTHMCGAPVVLTMLIHAPAEQKVPFAHTVEMATGGAAPPSTVIAAMEQMGFRVTHLYGLTETYGPASFCAWQDDWDGLPLAERASLMARQGVSYATLEGLMVADPATLVPVPRDGTTMGEMMLRGNTVMKGYLKNPRATGAAFAGGWFHTGDLAVWHPDGYIEIKDRARTSSSRAARTSRRSRSRRCSTSTRQSWRRPWWRGPTEHWGETPCAFVTLKPGATATAEDIVSFLPRHHRALQGAAPRRVRPAAQDLHRQDPEIRPARTRQGDRLTAATRCLSRAGSLYENWTFLGDGRAVLASRCVRPDSRPDGRPVRFGECVVTAYALDAMEDDALTVFDLERCVLTGAIVERQRDRAGVSGNISGRLRHR